MDDRSRTRRSKQLSYHLRHDPAAAGLSLDVAGWAEVADVLEALHLRRDELEDVVAHGSKPRFELSPDGRRIRARYGHSVPIELGHEPVAPPQFLYHGTSQRRVAAILRDGLRPRGRQRVHLSEDVSTARSVGARHGGRTVVLEVDAAAMHRDGHTLVRPADGTWLTEHVPARYLRRT